MIFHDRRQLLTASVASAAAAGLLAGKGAHAKPRIDIEPRGQVGIFERLPDLNLESYHDFLRGMRQWSYFYGASEMAQTQFNAIMKTNGITSDEFKKLSYEQILAMVDKDPAINLYGRAWLDGQWYKFKTLQDAFHSRADLYFSEMESADKEGPGTLELNPKMFIPDYTKHEIHNQLGGYVGDPFAGYIYLYDVLINNDGAYEQDPHTLEVAAALPLPKDGKVKRILDYGTGVGQYATSIKRRFPDVEVWGIDVGGPMVRYGHMRANDLGLDVNFAQRLAEDSKFPDGYFDIITSYLVHHEATADATKDIFKEVRRTLRPGGVYYPVDTYTNAEPAFSPFRKFVNFVRHRWNHEDWTIEWEQVDRVGEMKKAGLTVIADGPGPAARAGKNIMATVS